MRDIAKDSQQGGQLVTIPADMLSDCSLTRDNLADCKNSETLKKLIKLLAAKADELLPELNAKEQFLKTKLAVREKLILSTLLTIYRRLFDRIKANPLEVISGDHEYLKAEREKIAKENLIMEEGL